MGRRRPPVRLVDLHVRWLWQYAPEVSWLDPALAAVVPPRLPQTAGYLSDTAAAVVMLGGWPDDADPWTALREELARVDAEFCGRVLRDPEDVARWKAEPPHGLCWAMPGVAGLDRLVRHDDDLERLPALVDRLRVVQLATQPVTTLADESGLTPLGVAAIAALDRASAAAARPVAVELAELSPAARASVLDHLGSGLIPLYSSAAAPDQASLPPEESARIASAGGLLAVRPGRAVDPGTDAYAIATGFLGRDLATGEPGDAIAVLRWAASGREEPEFQALAAGRAGALLVRLAGGDRHA